MRECGYQSFENPLTELSSRAHPGAEYDGDDVGYLDVAAAMRTLWLSLLGGSLVVVEASTTLDRAVLRLQRAKKPLALVTSRDAQTSLFSAVVRGKLQKVLAIELGLSASTVASKLRYTIERMGLDCNISRLPLSVALLAHAIEHPQLVAAYTELDRSLNSPGTCSLVLKRCDRAMATGLSRTELEIAGHFLEGCSYEAIARARFTSVRTIANQVSSVFRKTGASGRFALLRAVIERAYPALPAPAAAAPFASAPANAPKAERATSLKATPGNLNVPPALLRTPQASRAALAH